MPAQAALQTGYSLEEIVESARLPAALAVAARITAAAESPNTSMDDIATILETDIALSTKVLRIANSPLFMGGGIDTVKNALVYVGLGDVVALVSASEVMGAFEDIPLHDNPYQFWYENLYAATAAQVIARHVCLSEGRLFTAGLLRGVGELAIRAALPKAAAEVLRRQHASGEALHKIEQDILGFHHADLGAALLEHWQLPRTLVCPVRNYIDPAEAGEYRVEAAVVHLANYIKNSHYEVAQPPLRDRLLHSNAAEDLQLIEQLQAEIDRLCEDAAKLIMG